METIRLVKEPEKFRAALYDGAEEIGQCTYVNARPGVWTLDHTIVDPRYGGRGLAGKLVRAVAEMAREAGVKIIPQCSYARVQFDRKPEFADVYEKE